MVYCFIAGMAIEILVSGMSFQQSLSSRLLSIPVNILIAWPYGRYRDLFIRIARRADRYPFLLRNLADLLAYVSNAVVSMAMGVVYGYFLEYCRRLFRVTGYV